MSRVKSKDTKPEMIVRRLIHSMGFRFRLHRKDLPGTPDLVFPRLKKIIFVHGCFWHGHNCRAGRNTPQTNLAYWSPKLERNRERDKENEEQLLKKGWNYLIIWECEIKNPLALLQQIQTFLEG